MAPCSDAIAESLTKELAKGLVGSDLPLSELQKELGVPRPLIFIASLVLGDETTAPPFSSIQLQQVEHLQRLYHECLNLDSNKNVFQLSATLIPCQEARNMIQKCIQAQETKMTVQANAVAASLLKETNKTTGRKKKKKQRIKKKSTVAHQKQEKSPEKSAPKEETIQEEKQTVASLDTDTESSDEEEEEQPQVLTPILQVKNQTMEQIASSSSESWVEVKKKRSLRSSEVSLSDMDSKDDEPVVDNATSSASNHVDETKKEDEESFVDIVAPSSSSPTIEETKEAMIQSLQEKVERLTLALAETESQLQQECHSHAKELQRHRESTEERIQALQLRLYISETRSRNYEEALEAHVEAVANNIVLTPRKSKRGTENDGGTDSTEDSSSSKPLYSRVAASK